MPKARKLSAASEILVSQIELAEVMGRPDNLIRKWEKAEIIVRQGNEYPLLENYRRVVDYLCAESQRKQASKAELDAETLRNKKLDAEAKEREAKKDSGEWIEAAPWLDAMETHIGDLRGRVKNLLLTEQPDALAGRSAIDIRELNQKSYTQISQQMRNAAVKLTPKQKEPKSDAI